MSLGEILPLRVAQVLASFWKWFSFILIWFAATLVGWVVAIVRHLRRLVAFDLQRVQVTEREEMALLAAGVEQASARRFLAWRRSLLIAGVPLSFCNALWQTYSSFGFFDHFGEIWSKLGNAVEIVRLLSLFGLSLAAFLALLLWKRPRASSRMLWCGLGIAFVIPLLLAAIPTHFAIDWSNLNQKSLEEMHGLAKLWQTSPEEPVGKAEARQTLVEYLQWIVDVFGALLYAVLALPSICAIFPSVLRACLRVKTLLPDAITPGWFLLSVIPLYFLLILILFVISSMVFREPVLLVSLGMFICAPLLHLLEIRRLMRPWNGTSSLRLTRLIAWTALALNLAAVVLIIRYLVTLEFHFEGELMKLFGWNPDTSIMRYADLFFWITDFLGRSVILTVAVADLLVAATLALGKHARVMNKSAEESD